MAILDCVDDVCRGAQLCAPTNHIFHPIENRYHIIYQAIRNRDYTDKTRLREFQLLDCLLVRASRLVYGKTLDALLHLVN